MNGKFDVVLVEVACGLGQAVSLDLGLVVMYVIMSFLYASSISALIVMIGAFFVLFGVFSKNSTVSIDLVISFARPSVTCTP